MNLTCFENDLVARAIEGRGCLAAEALTGPEKAAAHRAVTKGALYTVNYANGTHFETTDAGRAALAVS